MPKRTSEAADLNGGKSAAIGQETARPATTVEDDEMGEFEDKWEDEIESEEEMEADEAANGEEGEDGEGKSDDGKRGGVMLIPR
jgi:ribosome assembly protein RRB1